MNEITDLLAELRKEFETFKKNSQKESDAQRKSIQKLEKEVKDLTKEQNKLLIYVNNLMKKADTVIKNNFMKLRRSQVIDRQTINRLDTEVSELTRRK